MTGCTVKFNNALAVLSRSVEPVIFVYCFTLLIYNSALSNLYLQKVCMPDGPPQDINAVCHHAESLSVAADIGTLRTILKTCISGVVVLLAGAWKDRTGLCRPLILLALTGDMISTLVAFLGFTYWSSSAWIFAAIEGTVVGTTGGVTLVIMAANCYIIQNSSVESRTVRLSYMMSTFIVGGVVSYACGGLILSAIGYQYMLLLVAGLYTFTIFLAYNCIKDKPAERKAGKSMLRISTVKSVCCNIDRNSVGIWMMLAASLATNLPLNGEANVVLLFMEEKFDYTVTQAGYYTSYRFAVTGIFSFALSELMTKVFKLGDFKIAIFSGIITIFGSVSMAFAETFVELILYAFLDVLKPTLVSVIKSILSKLVRPEEIGVYLGMESVIGALIPLGILPLYGGVFNATVGVLPGAFYLISASCALISVLCISITFWIYGESASNTEIKCEKEKDQSIYNCEKGCDKEESQYGTPEVIKGDLSPI